MGMLDFNYIIINVLMLIVFIYAGKKVSESEKRDIFIQEMIIFPKNMFQLVCTIPM